MGWLSMAPNPWRYRCPEGHCIHHLGARRAYCDSCKAPYDKADVIDKVEDKPLGEVDRTE
jgi:hypothetical protein